MQKGYCFFCFGVLYLYLCEKQSFLRSRLSMNEHPEKIVVDSDLIPEVLLKVIEAKKLLSQGKAKNSSEAARNPATPPRHSSTAYTTSPTPKSSPCSQNS